jgi:hypothetical protein
VVVVVDVDVVDVLDVEVVVVDVGVVEYVELVVIVDSSVEISAIAFSVKLLIAKGSDGCVVKSTIGFSSRLFSSIVVTKITLTKNPNNKKHTNLHVTDGIFLLFEVKSGTSCLVVTCALCC